MMVAGEVINVSTDALGGLISEVGKVGLWLQAIGIVIVLWIIFQIITLVVNRKKRKALYRIENKLKTLERKIDLLLKTKRK